MSDVLTTIYPSDKRSQNQVDALLQQEGIRRDKNLDYTCGIFDDDMNLIATGSCFGNTLRCLAVSKTRQGEGLLNQIVSHLIDFQAQRGNMHLFLYTKCQSAKFFSDLGFFEIARVDGKMVFMENRRNGFSDYCKRLKKPSDSREKISSIVMNANPFTLGHRHLVERASSESDCVHLFILSEDKGPIPFAVRRKLVMEGVADLDNVICHDSGPYIISSATFPSYFLPDDDTVITTHAALDLEVFGKIAVSLGITDRFVGDEPFSHVTALYNNAMEEHLPELGINCHKIPRFELNGVPVSASNVRQLIHDGKIDDIKPLVPDGTWNYFNSPEAETVINAIKSQQNVIHY